MYKIAIGFAGVCWSVLSWAQNIPSVVQWRDIFQEVRQHTLFKELEVSYAKAPAAATGYTPIGVIQKEGAGCSVVIAEGENPKMRAILRFSSTAQETRALLLAAAAHELGHCLRVRHRKMSTQLWTLVAATDEGSLERQSLEKQVSLEEAYADAYAFVYIQDAHPELFGKAFKVMQALRAAPALATPFYQVQPLYEQLANRGLDASLALHKQVEAVIQQSKFPLD